MQTALAGDAAAQSASAKMLSAFKDWIDAAQVYRHEQGQEEPTQPPIALAISILSVGATYLRWLAELTKHDNMADEEKNFGRRRRRHH